VGLRVAQEKNGGSFSLKKFSLVRAEFEKASLRPEARGDGYTPRVAAAVSWLLGKYGDSVGDVAADFGDLFDCERNCFYSDYARAMSSLQQHGELIATYVRDWSGDGAGCLTIKSRQISTFVLLLKMKGVESAAWPWLYPVPGLCDSALVESQDVAEQSRATRLSIRHSFCLKVRSSVSAYVMDSVLVFFLFDVMRARSFYSHCIIARRKSIDVACTARKDVLSEQYWCRERDLCADFVRVMDERCRRRLPMYEDVFEYCHRSAVPSSLAFPNVFVTLTFAEWKFPSPAWMRPHLASQPEGSGLQTLHIYEMAFGVLRKLLGLRGVFWARVVEHLVRVEFQGRGTLHLHAALWALPLQGSDLAELVHSPKNGRSSSLGAYFEEHLECDVDVQVGSGFLNYINGYVTKASDAIDFSSKEYSAEDGEFSEHTDWKRTYRMLLKGSPALQEIYCEMSVDVQVMSRSAVVAEAFPPVPFEEPRVNVTARAYSALVNDSRLVGCCPLAVFVLEVFTGPIGIWFVEVSRCSDRVLLRAVPVGMGSVVSRCLGDLVCCRSELFRGSDRICVLRCLEVRLGFVMLRCLAV